jgi:hypothetical protein
MNTIMDKPATFDESCAQEVISPARPLQNGDRTSTASAGRLDRLDVWMWALLFCFGALVGRQVLPVVESWFNAF